MNYDSLPKGLDLSHWDSDVDWPAVKASGVEFVYIKATERMGVDDHFATNVKGAISQSIIWMPYMFCRPDDGPATALHFKQTVGAENVPAVLDWEANGVPAIVPEMWIDNLIRVPMAYYGPYPPDAITPKILACPRILPEYASAPRIQAWDGVSTPDWSKCWMIWQRSGSGRSAGVSTEVDLDVLGIDLGQFKHWYSTGDLGVPVIINLTTPPLIVREGDSGPGVEELQQRLGLAGFPVDADAQFGPQTKAAVEAFQTAKGLTGDGIVGPRTLSALPALV